MKYNFDEIINRRGTNSLKWDAGPLLKKIGFTEKFDEDTIPLFLADMDFAIPRPVLKALHKRVDQQIFGYTTQTSSQEYNDAIKNWFSRRFDWEIQDEEIVYCPGTVHALNVAVKAFSKPGDGVIIQRPVYPPCHRK
jgi:cystathionine beta-lyase